MQDKRAGVTESVSERHERESRQVQRYFVALFFALGSAACFAILCTDPKDRTFFRSFLLYVASIDFAVAALCQLTIVGCRLEKEPALKLWVGMVGVVLGLTLPLFIPNFLASLPKR